MSGQQGLYEAAESKDSVVVELVGVGPLPNSDHHEPPSSNGGAHRRGKSTNSSIGQQMQETYERYDKLREELKRFQRDLLNEIAKFPLSKAHRWRITIFANKLSSLLLLIILLIQFFVYFWLHYSYFEDKVSTMRLCSSYKWVEYYASFTQFGNASNPIVPPGEPGVPVDLCTGRLYNSWRVLLAFQYYSSIVVGVVNGALGANTQAENIWNDALNQVVTTTYFMRTMCLYTLIPLQSEWDDQQGQLTIRTLLFSEEGYVQIAYASISLAGIIFFGLVAMAKHSWTSLDNPFEDRAAAIREARASEDPEGANCKCSISCIVGYVWANVVKSLGWICVMYYCYILGSAFVFYISTINYQGKDFTAFLQPRGQGLVFVTYTVYGTILLSIMEFLLFKELNPGSATRGALDERGAYYKALVKLSRYEHLVSSTAKMPPSAVVLKSDSESNDEQDENPSGGTSESGKWYTDYECYFWGCCCPNLCLRWVHWVADMDPRPNDLRAAVARICHQIRRVEAELLGEKSVARKVWAKEITVVSPRPHYSATSPGSPSASTRKMHTQDHDE